MVANPARSSVSAVRQEVARLLESVSAIVHGKPELVRHVATAVLARGHVLLEDVPGTGKTTLAHAAAEALGCSFARIQFTADLLPSDIVGVSVYDASAAAFRFHAGPIFAQVVLADEINRTPPRTQSALLEAMNDGQVTVDGELHPLPRPFFVVATQNPLEHHGTYPLPESQIDRFLMRLEVGYPDRDSERRLLRESAGPRAAAQTVLDPDRVVALQDEAMAVRMHAEIEDYVLDLVEETRRHPAVRLGASPRAAQALARAIRARAFLDGRDHATPDDVQALLLPVLGHRLVAARDPAGASGSAADVLRAVRSRVQTPR